jgi:hypothetical protein
LTKIVESADTEGVHTRRQRERPCPTQWKTNWGTRITQGRPVTDPDVLGMINPPDGEILVETPEALWEEP